MAVCEPCKSQPHSEKPAECRGGTWCDCQHRLPHVVEKPQAMTEINTNTKEL